MLPDLWANFTKWITDPGVEQLVLLVTALATAGSVITALVISRGASRRQDARDRFEQRASLERRAERQAVLIRTDTGGTVEGAHLGNNRGYQVQVESLSDLPIYEVTVTLIADVAGTREEHTDQPMPFMGPHDSRIPTAFSADRSIEVRQIATRVQFLDAFGDRWTVDSFGRLTLDAARTIRSFDS
ncbi:MAG TPA: hypothetical protein VGM45_08815 [Gaiellaceae bacterium]|jgi:hypothetical protein